MLHYRILFSVITFWIVVATGIIPAWGQGPWNAEQKSVIQSFVTQYKAIQNDDMARFKNVVLPNIHIGGKPYRRERIFALLMKMNKEDPANCRNAYNPDRIVSIKITGDIAKMDLLDTKSGKTQHFTFQQIGEIWKWATLH